MVPEFEAMQPSDVVVGRGRSAKANRAPYIEAVRASDAGRIKLEEGEKIGQARRYLQDAAKEVGKRVRAGYESSENAIYWKIVAPK